MERIGQMTDIQTARDLGVVSCRRCTAVWPRGTTACGRCGRRLQSRDTKSLQRGLGALACGVDVLCACEPLSDVAHAHPVSR